MKKLIFAFLFLAAGSAWAAWAVKYVSVAGGGTHAGTSEANAWTLAEAITNAAAGDQVNVIADTYTLAADAIFANAGTTLAPIWWRGYKTTIGDKDTAGGTRVVGTDIPKIDADTATDQVVISGAHQIFSNIGVTSICTDSGGAVNVTGGNIRIWRCNFENTANNSGARAISSATVAPNLIFGTRLKAHTGAATAVNVAVTTHLFGCHIIGGAIGMTAGASCRVSNTVIESFATTGVSSTGATNAVVLSGLSIYAAATNGILVTAIPTTGLVSVENTIIGGCTNGINNNTGGNTNGITLIKTHFYACTNNQVGMAENADVTSDLGAAMFNIDNDTDPFVAKGSNDFTLAAAAVDKSAGYPGLFEGQTVMTGYPDIGAVRHVDPSAAGQKSFSW